LTSSWPSFRTSPTFLSTGQERTKSTGAGRSSVEGIALSLAKPDRPVGAFEDDGQAILDRVGEKDACAV
jgi:hypothetical protein